MTRNVALTLTALTATIAAASLTLTGCAPASPADRARAVAESYAVAFADSDSSAIEAMICEDGYTGYKDSGEAKVTGHVIGEAVELESGRYDVTITISSEGNSDWISKLRVMVDGESEPCIISQESTGSN